MNHLLPLVFLLSAISQALAALPDRPLQSILDQADMLTPPEEQVISEKLRQWRAKKGIEAFVVTIRSRSSIGENGGTWESFATNLFNRWGIGTDSRNDGVLFLMSKEERKTRIEVGSGFGRRHDPSLKRIIDEQMTPAFRAGRFGGGVIAAIDSTIERLSGPVGSSTTLPPEAPTPQQPLPVTSQTKQSTPTTQSIKPKPSASKPKPSSSPINRPAVRPDEPGTDPTSVAALTGGLGLGGWGLRHYLRRRRKKCSRCGTMTELLDENADDIHLDDGRKLQEAMGSVDYDVRKCPACRLVDVVPYRTWFTTTEDCPSCHYRTVRRTSRILVYADYNQSGRKLIMRDCKKCGHHSEQTVIIPRREHSSTSGSSSFGSSGGSSGGSSSGGGASGGW